MAKLRCLAVLSHQSTGWRQRRRGPRQALAPLAMALAALLGAPAQAQFSSSGVVNVYPGNAAVPAGAGNADLGNVGLFVGNGAFGSFSAAGGSQLRVGSLLIGPSGAGNGDGSVVIDGMLTKVSLIGDGFSDGVINRLGVGEWGKGSLMVSGGATLDGRAESASCLGQFHYCNNFIGNAAGSTGSFTVTGAGSNASFLRFFGVGGLAVFHPPIDSSTFGTPGGTTRGTVNVLAGGLLTTDNANLGLAPAGGSPQGNERSFADGTIDGAGSLWRVTGGTLEPSQFARVNTATHRNAWATLAITNGGQMQIEGNGAAYTQVGLTTGGGRTDMLVSGAGSRLHFVGQSGILIVGQSLGTATLELRNGGVAEGMFYTGVGRNGSSGTLLVDGSGSLLRIDNTATASANTVTGAAVMEIGRNGGNGTVTVSNGGRVEVLTTTGTTNGTSITLARDVNSAGTLNIAGGSVVLLRSTTSAAGTAAESSNPVVLVGRDGSGFLNISGGGQLLLEGGAVSTPTNRRSTALYIGGRGDALVGGRGIAIVSGVGSEVRVTGQDTFIGVGIGPQSSGQLTVSNQGLVSGLGMAVGRSGGVGVLKVDGGTLSFSGQQTAGNQSGAFFVVGSGGTGVGVASLSNGSLVTLTNPGSAGAGVSIGGSGAFPGGEGSLTLQGGSRIEVYTQPGLNSFAVGREGSGFLRLRGASSIDLVDGVMQVGRSAGSDGTVIASEGSSITAGWLGVGARKTATGDEDGGTGTFVLIDSTLNATDIVIGTNGFLGGRGTINGNVVNRGIFAPGLSPGTMEITGSFVAAAGSRLILEVESDGNGGFNTDQVIFGAGQALDLTHLNVEFRFLGATDPNAFRASGGGTGFGVDSFFQLRQGDGSTSGLDRASFATASFSATAVAYTISNFSFSAAQGASFTATPVPEPGSAAMLFAGLAALGWLVKRRSA